MYRSYTYRILLILLAAPVLWACSQENNTFINRNFHNLTAYFNAYYLAEERMEVVDKAVLDTRTDDFNHVLEILPRIDTNKLKSLEPDLEYVTEMATLPIKKHKISHLVDDSYILIGKAKMYDGEFNLSMNYFRFVNTKSEDKEAKNLALAYLQRAYLEAGEIKNAELVAEYLSKQELQGPGSKVYHLTEASYYQRRDRLSECLEHLEQALPNIEDKEERARLYFTAGQLNQLLNKPKEAYKRYKKVLKNNPTYELSFFSKLNMNQVSGADRTAEIEKTRKYFQKLLNDDKNLEYRDRIYYEMGLFDLKLGNRDEAIKNLKKSTYVSEQNKIQKGYSYLKLGQIYYESREYKKSQKYYDSTVAVLSKDTKGYEEIAERDRVLNEFVEYITIVETEDSLQNMAKMDSTELHAYISAAIEKEIADRKKAAEVARLEEERKKREKEEELAKLQEENQFNISTLFPFYNPPSLQASKAAFREKWGNRKLEDNWRLSSRDRVAVFEEESVDPTEGQATDTLARDTSAIYDIDRSAYYENIPRTDEEFEASNKRLIDAYYHLGKLYDQNLMEPIFAIETFQELNNRFPDNKHYVEVNYYLYLLCRKEPTCEANTYKSIVLNQYPNSIYAKLIQDPNYLATSKQANDLAHEMYDRAFSLHDNDRFFEARELLYQLENQYPDSDIEDKVAFLEILNDAKIEGAHILPPRFQSFANDYGTSPLKPKAEHLKVEYEKLLSGKSTRDTVEHEYKLTYAQKHVYFIEIDTTKTDTQEFYDQLSAYNNEYKEAESLVINTASQKDKRTLFFVVALFKDYDAAMAYHKSISETFIRKNSRVVNRNFAISEKNYQTMMTYKDFEIYHQFFKDYY